MWVIRNITGRDQGTRRDNDIPKWGAFSNGGATHRAWAPSSNIDSITKYFIFNANDDTDNYGNPMKNHATGPDIHPYNISLLPVISY